MLAKSIKVLLIEDNRVESRLLQEMLIKNRDVAITVEVVDRLIPGLQRLAQGGNDIVLSDLNLPDSKGLETCNRIRSLVPEVPVVVLTGMDDETLAGEAVAGGAQDYLVKQSVDGPALARILRYAIARHKALADQIHRAENPKAGKVLAFLGAKGGVGTTTVALNVALALARQKKPVIVVELRPWFGTMAQQLRQGPTSNLHQLIDLDPERIGEQTLASCLVKAPLDLRVLFGPQKVEEFREIPAGQADAIIGGLSAMADYVVLDLPCQPSEASQSAIRHAHFVGLVIDRDPGCLVPARMTLSLLQEWGVTGNLVGTVVVNRSLFAAPMKLTDLRSHLGCDVIGVVPPATDACLRAQESGTPLVLSQPDNAAATALNDIAARVAAEKVVAMRF